MMVTMHDEKTATSKKVLGISASPRRGGNSDTLCDRFMDGARDAGHEAEKIFLRGKTIRFCLGCMVCQGNGGTCVQRDDMAGVLDRMTAADVIVMATPVYFYTMNAQMKTLIDRTHPKYPDMGEKDVYFIVTAADPDRDALERTIEGFRGFLSCYEGLHERGIVCGTGVGKIGEVDGTDAMDRAYEMGTGV
jgi:multimeric flavodoxin WrbA